MTTTDSATKHHSKTDAERLEKSQVMTPVWAAGELVEQFFPNLSSTDLVIEPSCGTGAFLRAIPDYVPAIGVEIDPALARQAIAATGRQVIVGDFRTVDLPVRATAMIGNPPFELAAVEGFLARALTLLEEEGRVGFILPCFAFQTAGTVERIAKHWSIEQQMIPRNIFGGGLSKPLCFAQFTKGAKRGLIGFALYHETAAVNRLRLRYRALLAAGEGNVWTAVVRAAMETLGGTATLQDIYREIEGNRPTTARTWHAKVRQQVQKIGVRVGESVWALTDFQPRQLRLVA